MDQNKYNYKDMLLESASGFMMPFALETNEDVQVVLPFGEQNHPTKGGKFYHNGVDYAVKDKPLYAIATGMVIGLGEDASHENYIVVRYGKYDVTYKNITEAYSSYGEPVKAGKVIAKSGDYLHLGVTFDGEDLDPETFIAMIWANIQQLAVIGIQSTPIIEDLGENIKTSYDDNKDEILMLMLRWFPTYMNEISNGAYQIPKKTETTLRNVLIQASDKNYYYERMPTIGNPLGLSKRAAPLAGKIQDILIGDFLAYLASRHGVYPASWDEEQKKNFLMKQPKTA